MTGFIVAAVVIVLVVGAVLVAKRLPHPEQSATHTDASATSTSDELYGGAARPAGPDVDEIVPPPGSQKSPDGPG